MAKKRKKIADPHAEREAQKYENPIPSREYILDYLRDCGRLLRRDELLEVLGLNSPEQQEALRRRLRAMERDGQLVFTRRGGYGVADKMDLIRGRVIGHKDGFGFVVPDDGSGDLFLTPQQMRAVFDGDRVLVHVTGVDRRGRREAALAEIIERNTLSVVGRFFEKDGIMYVTPENKRITHDILIPTDQQGNAHHGQIVIAEIIAQPSARLQAVGHIVEVLGEHMAPGMETTVAIRNYRIPHIWPEAVISESAGLSTRVAEKDKQGRLDLRDLPLVTIDGEDAKDFDDAVYCQKRRWGGWTLYVAIADVSHYVQVGTALDQEAAQRGNSVYFPGEVVPMLPEVLSNELCSLKPAVDRLALVCEMAISGSGKLSRYQFHEAVIHSHARLTYTEVTKLLETSPSLPRQGGAKNPPLTTRDKEELLPHLQALYDLYQVLHENREERGAIDFETTETRVIFGARRKIEQIVPAKRTVAHCIIEECMLMANVAAARFVLKQKLPSLFRIHAGPTLEKLQDLREFLNGLGLRLPGGKEPKTADYSQLLKMTAKRPDAHIIQRALLRSLSQAVYSPENIGHFGLAFPAYAHFTSPIRRYPDLLLHRAIRYAITNNKRKKIIYDAADMSSFGEQCSMTERRADEATRDALDWLKCEFIKDRVGEELNGIITNVTNFGLFVELQDIYVEGLVHVTALKNDYYHFDPLRYRLRGERTGNTYTLGDKLKVRIARVDLDSRQIDFEPVTHFAKPIPATKKPKKKITKKRSKKRGR